jgi:hypothetical protein
MWARCVHAGLGGVIFFWGERGSYVRLIARQDLSQQKAIDSILSPHGTVLVFVAVPHTHTTHATR